jgi:hypothetical protein
MPPFRRRRTPFLLAAVEKNGDLGSADPVPFVGRYYFKKILFMIL